MLLQTPLHTTMVSFLFGNYSIYQIVREQQSITFCFAVAVLYDECLFFSPGTAWIGLYDNLITSWSWSLNQSSFYGEAETTFRNWDSSQPNNEGGQQYCVTLLGSGKWGDYNCDLERYFVCYNGEFF